MRVVTISVASVCKDWLSTYCVRGVARSRTDGVMSDADVPRFVPSLVVFAGVKREGSA